MVKQKDDAYDQDDSEYQYTDDDVSYEIETEEPYMAAPAVDHAAQSGVMGKVKQHKRLLIGGGAFVLLFIIIYKIITPANTTPATNIVPIAQQASPTAAPAKQLAANEMADKQKVEQVAAGENQAQPITAASKEAPQSAAVPEQSVIPLHQGMAQPPVSAAPQAVSQAGYVMPPSGASVVAAQGEQSGMSSYHSATMPAANIADQAAAPASVVTENQYAPSTMSQYEKTQTIPDSRLPATVQDRVQASEAVSRQLAEQLTADYQQTVAKFSQENEALQARVKALNARVGTLETQLNQILQVLIEQNKANNKRQNVSEGGTADHLRRVGYNVQAIIPGRAWLKSDSGDTVTVAEGDMIAKLGRVTKIDPYDGVVEIDTGRRMVSLSYGDNA